MALLFSVIWRSQFGAWTQPDRKYSKLFCLIVRLAENFSVAFCLQFSLTLFEFLYCSKLGCMNQKSNF